MKFLTVPLQKTHRKKEFHCGKSFLDHYLHRQASQDIKRKLSACFVLEEEKTKLVKGYYTLSSSSIDSGVLPEEIRTKLPKSYFSTPVILLGRLAVDKRFQGQNFGKLLLLDAMKRCYEISKSIGSFALAVDPLDEDAENFYRKFGFVKLPDSGKMFLPMKTIEQLFK